MIRNLIRIKFIFIIVFFSLIIQWMQQIFIVASKIFKIYRYYEKSRLTRFKFVIENFDIDEQLIKFHEMFSKKFENEKTIIVIAYETLMKRNESSKLKNWKITTKNWSKKKTKRHEIKLTITWNVNFANCFEIVVINECSKLKNVFIQINIIIQWMNECDLSHFRVNYFNFKWSKWLNWIHVIYSIEKCKHLRIKCKIEKNEFRFKREFVWRFESLRNCKISIDNSNLQKFRF